MRTKERHKLSVERLMKVDAIKLGRVRADARIVVSLTL
jgi:hypothetical protein